MTFFRESIWFTGGRYEWLNTKHPKIKLYSDTLEIFRRNLHPSSTNLRHALPGPRTR